VAHPTPEAVKAARTVAGHSQEVAAGLVGLGDKNRWSAIERGRANMDPARWALYLLCTGQHHALKLTRQKR